MRVAALVTVFLASFLFCPTVRAELNFCNAAPLTIETAVGEPAAGKWQTRGWYKLKPGECATVVGGDLTSRNYYAYASTPGEKWKWEGDSPMCTSWNAFTITHPQCEPDMLRKFTKVDTGDSKSFNHWFSCSQCIDSRLVNAVQINIPFLEGLANQAAPLSYRTNDWQDIGPVDIQYGVSRSPLSLSINGNQVSISTRLSYWLSVSHNPPIIGRQGLASCGIDEAQPTADVKITTIFGITEDGKLASKTRTYLTFPTPCNLTIFDIDARGYIQDVAQPQLDRIAATIDSRISEIDISRVINSKDIYGDGGTSKAPITKFTFNYQFGDHPGIHVWTKVNERVWTESHPTGQSDAIDVIGRITVDGDAGLLLRNRPKPEYEYFIPDTGGKTMFLRIRLRGTAWSFLGEMQNIQH